MSSVAAYPAYPACMEARGIFDFNVGEHEPGGPEPGGA